MDKFGFFNLLNSFFPKNFQNDPKDEPNKPNSPDFLTDLFSNISKQNQQNFSSNNPTQNGATNTSATPNLNATKNSSNQNAVKTFAPLQHGMLSTMANHDHFVKRVKEKHKS